MGFPKPTLCPAERLPEPSLRGREGPLLRL